MIPSQLLGGPAGRVQSLGRPRLLPTLRMSASRIYYGVFFQVRTRRVDRHGDTTVSPKSYSGPEAENKKSVLTLEL
jgi:hypothetical protein